MTLANAVKVSTGVVSLIGTILLVHSYFAKANELEKLKAYTEYSFEELKLEKIEDKVAELEIKPEASQQYWEKEKLIRLKAQKERIIRRIEHNDKAAF